MLEIDIENVAGIRSGTATLEPGVNAIQASNWQGKTSLIAAIETAMGCGTRLTEGADHGRVRLETPTDAFEVELVRQDGQIRSQGDAYLTDEQDMVCAELFAFLGESNAIRRAVREGESLEPTLSRPLDLENIDAQIGELRDERREIEAELDSVREAARELPTHQERMTQLEAELEALREEREEVVSRMADDDGSDRRDALSDRRAARDRTRQQVEDLKRQIDDFEGRLESKRDELESIEVPEVGDLAQRLEENREELRGLESKEQLLQDVYNANKRVLDEDEVALLADVERGLVEDELACWVCGQQAGRTNVEDRLEAIEKNIAKIQRQVGERRDEIETLETERAQVEERRRSRVDLEDRIQDLESRLADRRTALEDAQKRLADLEEDVDVLESEVAASDEQLTDLESDIKFKEAELNDVREELQQKERAAGRRDQIQDQLEQVETEIETLRTRKERIKETVHEEFDAAMQEIVEAFEPGFERAWLDDFELRIARSGRGSSINALSEGEVELLGVMAALAGYEAFDVRDRLPVMLLDGLGGLAGEHLHRLVDYLETRTEILVTTAYPEVGEFDGHTISPDGWSVVSDGVGVTP